MQYKDRTIAVYISQSDAITLPVDIKTCHSNSHSRRINQKMRNVIASIVTFVLVTTLVFLVVVPQETQCVAPLAVAQGAMAVLGPLVKSFLADLLTKRAEESVDISVWMHNGDIKLNGCGFYFKATGYSGGNKSVNFPREFIHRCDTLLYTMRMTSQSATYSTKVYLGNEQAKDIELQADGWHDTFVNVLCIGLNKRTITAGPRAFCINNDILKACKELKNKWNGINLETNDIKMTRTTRGIHKILFHDVERLINGFERFHLNPNDEDVMSAICERIDLVQGTTSDDNNNCPAKRTEFHRIVLQGRTLSWGRDKDEDKNPYGCDRFTNRKR